MPPLFRSILCADWSKNPRGREVYRADTVERRIMREAPIEGWTVEKVLARARALKAKTPALVAFDAPLGVPLGYFRAVKTESPRYGACKTFGDWLAIAGLSDSLFLPVDSVTSWSLQRPFFALRKGKGNRKSWEARLKELGIDPLRSIDRTTKAKPPFIVSGIPGSVGSAACDLWRGLLPFLGQKRPEIATWPFDGDLDELSRGGRIVVGEIYPRAAYAVALSSEAPADRAPLDVAKTSRAIRQAAIRAIRAARWVNDHGVSLENLDEALESSDAFDALVTAAAMLRCTVEDTPFSRDDPKNARAEGGILGSGSVALGKPAKRFAAPAVRAHKRRDDAVRRRCIPCPIPRCPHMFCGSRGGWDSHVASLRNHKTWRRKATDPQGRKRLFRHLYEGFFR